MKDREAWHAEVHGVTKMTKIETKIETKNRDKKKIRDKNNKINRSVLKLKIWPWTNININKSEKKYFKGIQFLKYL